MNQAMTTPEQPYFTVRVTKCGECPKRIDSRFDGAYCGGQTNRSRFDTWEENRNGIGPSCPLWPQRVQQEKQE